MEFYYSPSVSSLPSTGFKMSFCFVNLVSVTLNYPYFFLMDYLLNSQQALAGMSTLRFTLTFIVSDLEKNILNIARPAHHTYFNKIRYDVTMTT